MPREKSRVLVVDDEPDILSVVEFMLQADYEVAVFEDPIDLMLESVMTPEPKAVITDLMMPSASGLVILHWLRKHYPQVRRIVLTAIGYPQPEAQELAHVYLTKPEAMNVASLYDAIEATDA